LPVHGHKFSLVREKCVQNIFKAQHGAYTIILTLTD